MSILNHLEQYLTEKKQENKLDPKAKVRNRPEPIFSDKSKFVNDNADHFPINSENRARNALAEVNKYKKCPKWFNGTLEQLKKKVVSAVHKKYPSIKITDKALD